MSPQGTSRSGSGETASRAPSQGAGRFSLPPRLGLPLALALLTALVYGAAGLAQSGGEPTAPLDDAYIYYQYARTFAAGQPFAYQPGDPPTTGATSVLHLLLLAPWFLAGVRGAAAVAVTFLGGAAALAATLWLVRDLLERRADRETGLWGMLLFAASGPLAWGFFSGMELPLVHLGFVASAHALLTPATARRRVLLLSAFALARPEGLLFPAALLAARGAARLARRAGPPVPEGGPVDPDPAAAADARTLAIPLLVGLVPFLLAWLLTGTPGTQSMRAKALLFEGSTTPGELASRGITYFFATLKGLFGGAQADAGGALSANRWQVGAFFPPLALPLFLLGLLPEAAAEAARRRAGFFLGALAWFFGGLLLESTLLPYPSHWNRYTMPFFPLFLLGVVLGARRLGRIAGEIGPTLARGVLGLAVFLSALGWVFLAVGYGRNVRDIHNQHVAGGRWIARNLPPGARVAINDAGALAYFGERRVLDLLGLVSRGPTEPVNEGAGALFEYLESLPESSRPTHFAVYPDWFRLGDSGLFGPTIHTLPLFGVSIAGSPLPLTISAAEWGLAGSGARPVAIPAGWSVADELDVADLASERAHGYAFARPGPGFPESDVLALSYAGEGAPRVADGGRLLVGGERFRMAARGGAELVLVARTDGAFRLDVRVNGTPAGTWNHPGPAGVWSDAVFTLPAGSAGAGRVTLELDVPAGFGMRSYRVFHYWVCQRG